MIRFTDVHKAFGAKVVLEGMTLDIPDGQTTVIIGFSGTGKSVALKHIVGLLAPDQGQVEVDGGAGGAASAGRRGRPCPMATRVRAISPARLSTPRALSYDSCSSAASSSSHRKSVIPSSCCGTTSAAALSNRKKWQYLWMYRPRKRKCQSMIRIGPSITRSLRPVSSAVSRKAASAGDSSPSRCPLGKPQCS